MAKKTSKSKSLQLIAIVFVALLAIATVFILSNKSLYNQLTRTGASGLYGPYLDITKCDGTWNTTTCFNVTNITESPVAITYFLDCWDPTQTKCADKTETIILKAGETVKLGLGSVCSKWQLDINWSGRTDGGWDWGGIVEASTVCNTASPTPTATPTVTVAPTPTPTPCTNTISFQVK